MVASSLLLLTLAAAPDDFAESTRAWQRQRLERLQADGGWLTLAGLGLLKEGANAAGSAPKVHLTFPADAPAQLGTFTRAGHAVSFAPAPGVAVTLAGKPFTGGALKSDAAGAPDVIRARACAGDGRLHRRRQAVPPDTRTRGRQPGALLRLRR